MKTNKTSNPVITFDHKRDAYGFTVRPQHLQRYREYANIYKEEEEERSEKWKSFLDRQAETESSELASAVGEDEKVSGDEVVGEEVDASLEKGVDGHQTSGHVPGSEDSTIENGSQKEELPASEVTKIHRVQLWSTIRSSLHIIEDMMSARVKKKTASVKDERNKNGVSKDEKIAETEKSLSHSDDAKSPKGAFEEDSEDEFYDVERSDPSPDSPRVDGLSTSANGITAYARHNPSVGYCQVIHSEYNFIFSKRSFPSIFQYGSDVFCLKGLSVKQFNKVSRLKNVHISEPITHKICSLITLF
ncbi:uncharacterized protein LOC127087363 [Lathyrus oleraceus]|uniref:uncharacterized protein LOC127087363 n=1 Tax=Pisum sativum TaxID=3888 RepID=UPI0021D0F4ED|nr:uncharacterized protein LOC127087363 [Pisum sativum]